MRAPWDKANLLFPQSVLLDLRQALTLKGLDFFLFYQELRRYELGKPVETDLTQDFIRALNALLRSVSPTDGRTLSPSVVGMLSDARSNLLQLLGRVERGIVTNPILWNRVNTLYVPLMVAVARDKGVYLKVIQAGTERWGVFRKMTENQVKLERLKETDPETYALIQTRNMTLAEIDQNISTTIESQGLSVTKKFLMGKPVLFGADPNTGDEWAFDRDGDVLTAEEYITKQKRKSDIQKTLAKTPARIDSPVEDLRSLNDDQLSSLQGPLEWDAMTDDKAKRGRLTRIFATKRVDVPIIVDGVETRKESLKVIVSGRYKGIFLDDMVNANGRMIEGTAFGFDPKSNSTQRIPKKLDPGAREPYVSVADVIQKTEIDGEVYEEKVQKLFLKIPGTGPWTELRRSVKLLACNAGGKRGCLDTISYHPVEGSNAAGFYFEPKDFGTIREALKGLSLSEGALLVIQDYFKELSRAEEATDVKNLRMYSAEALGNFKPGMALLSKQKQALAWMDANGNKGTCALDVGVGKSSFAVANMQKMVRDGYTDAGATYTKPNGDIVETNGRFLFVCPETLAGNMPNEIIKFLQDPSVLLSRMDTVPVEQFARHSFSGTLPKSLKKVPFWKRFKGQWDPSLYVAIFFDEGHEIVRVPNSKRFRAANELYHPHKIILTASPMESEPVDAYLAAAITENKPMSGSSPDVRKNRIDMRRFMDRFTDRVDGRVTNVKDDPGLKRDLDTWVKRKIYYADKADVEEFRLPQLTRQTVALQMSPELERVYRACTAGFADIMRGMVLKFRDQKLTGLARNPELEKSFSMATAPLLKILNGLANSPASTLARIADMKETGTLPGGKKIPKILERILATRFPVKAPELRALARTVGAPKLDESYRIVSQIQPESRALLFSDDKALCMQSGLFLSERLPGIHAVALSKSIHFFEGGQELSQFSYEVSREDLESILGPDGARVYLNTQGTQVKVALPLKANVYRRYPGAPAADVYNVEYDAPRWQEFALKELICPRLEVKTCSLLGSSYQTGHNLQPFNTVIHLDRDSWSNENMKQRTGRSWRQGQKSPVKEFILDAVYQATDEGVPVDGDTDKTLDQIRSYFQQMEAGLFQKIIKDAQAMTLGTEWRTMRLRNSSTVGIDKRIMELMTSPYVGRSV